ncbi:ribonuclease HI [Bacillus pumilus]|uniref:ribonuclease HI n=1 Tax=Bacillus pumilus TaxID=1408 RepID=UPI002280D19B|nr:ribonuclease HI [Bacillus pumilus]MCY7679899.1 ribonuclease HI [Bacillus pumilus]
MEKVIVYTDGGCRGNQNETNVGGWGAVLSHKGKEVELKGGKLNTTNNVMELTGVIEALKHIKTNNIHIEVYADSAYVVNGMNSWVKNWIKNNWRKSNKKPVENKELWMELNELVKNQASVTFLKVKGHSGDAGNEKADELANQAMDEL